MKFHDLKDIVMVYSSTPEGKTDYSWDKAKIVVWDHKRQLEGELYFTGSSSRPEKEINFNVEFKDDIGPDLIEAFDLVYTEMMVSNFNTDTNWRNRFLEIMINNRQKKIKEKIKEKEGENE